jgi:DNA-binding SARP family transcriptional activator/predicted ATPase
MGPSPHPAAPHALPTCVVTLLGGFQVLSNGAGLSIPEGKATALFAFLLLHPHTPHTREQLVERFWEEAPPERGQRRLSNTLYQLQKSIGAGWLERDGATLSLVIPPHVTVDVRQFETWAKSDSPPLWQKAVQLYRGDLLPERYEEWVLARRVGLRDTYITLLLKLAHHAEREGDSSRALEWYRRLAAAEPLYEEGQRGVIRTLMALDRPAEALEVYQQVEQLLKEEMGVPPAATTQLLGEEVRREVANRRHTAFPTANPFIHPPFVGRTAERAKLLALLQQATTRQGGLCLVLGEAGVGKSRLLKEFANAATWRGWQVAWGYGQELTLPAAYAPLQEALTTALPPVRRQQVAHLVQPLWLGVVARAFPSLASLMSVPLASDHETYTPERVALALQRLLEGLHQIAPHLFILEDIQWADEGFWTVMSHLRESLAHSNCLLVLSARLEALEHHPNQWAIIEAWSRQGMPTFTIEGLKPTDLSVLIHTVTPHYSTTPPLEDVATRLHVVTNGNPLLALTLLQTDTSTTDVHLHTLFQRRLAPISPTARTLLQAASVLGYRFRYDHLEKLMAISGTDTVALPRFMGELEQQGMVMVEGNGYRFHHDTLRRVVYEGMDAKQQLQWHHNALLSLENEQGIEPTRLLHHAEQSDNPPAISRHALAAGQTALSGFAMASAKHYFSLSLDHLPDHATESRYQALMGRLQAENVLGNRAAQLRDLETLQAIAEQTNQIQWLDEVREQYAYYHWAIGAFQEAATTIQQGLDTFQHRPNHRREASLRIVLGRVLREWGRYDEAQQQIRRAQTLYHQSGDKEGYAIATDLLGGIAWQTGNHPLGADLHQQAAELFRANGNIIREAQALNNLGANLWSLERYPEARTTHKRALYLSREQGHRRGEADNLDNMGGVAWILGEYEEAIEFYSQALAIRRSLKDRWGMAISLGNLGSAYRLWGKSEEALPFYAEALELNEELSRKHGLGYVLHGQGLAFLDLGSLEVAQAALQQAIEIRATLSERQHWVESQAGLALVTLTMGESTTAHTVLLSALAELSNVTRAAIRQWVHYVAFLLYQHHNDPHQSLSHLQAAHHEMLTVAATLPTTEREGFLDKVPLNRQVRTAIEALSHQISVSLVAADVPLGRKLTPDDYVNIRWTLYSPLDDDIPNKAQRRHSILQRLSAEAALQGATPSDEDLASALNVATRTIERDLAALRDAGIHLPTRRRK